MGRKLLTQVRVASPCNVPWNSMEGDERTRFCGQCKHNVYNISEMTSSEAESFLSAATGRTCIRMYRRHDGTILTRDCPVGLAAVRRRLGYAAAVTVVMVFGAFSMAMARVKSGDPEAKENLEQLKDRARDWPVVGQLLGKKELPPPPPSSVVSGLMVMPPSFKPQTVRSKSRSL